MVKIKDYNGQKMVDEFNLDDLMAIFSTDVNFGNMCQKYGII